MHPVLRLYDGYDDTSPQLRDEVKALQKLLTDRGFLAEPDGFFGDGTEDAVLKFQQENELPGDGIVGPRTWAALEGQPPPDATAVAFPTTFEPQNAGLLIELAEAAQYRDVAVSAARKYVVPLCLLAGMVSRESGWGRALRPRGPGGTGDFTPRAPRPPLRPGSLPPDGGGFGRGLAQIDYDAHEFARSGQWKDPASSLMYAAGLINQNRVTLGPATSLEGTALWCAALAAYNCGLGNVTKAIQSGRDVDFFTTGRNYGRDTLNRAGWFLLMDWA